MKRVIRQWLAGLLSVVLLLTLLPAAALAEEAGGATGQTAVEQVQALIDELPEAEEITAENRADVQAQIDAIDAAMVELTEDQAVALDTTRYDAAVAALLALDTPSALEQVQALIDALPDAEDINEDNRADVEAQLNAIDEAKQALEDGDLDALDITRYLAAVEALLALDDMAGSNVPKTIAFPDDLPGGGTGDANNPYQISTAEQLAQLSEHVNAGNTCEGQYFKLTTDIDLKGGPDNPWTPIGNSHAEFKGTFDGGSHTVSGLYIDGSSIDNVGLFGYILLGGTVKNLGVSGEINNVGSETGGIAGFNYGTITGCHSACDISSGDNVGGIVGVNRGTVKDCYNVGEISGGNAGGIAGTNYKTVSGCYNAGSVNGRVNAGGIAGRSSDQGFIIENCYNVGTVTGGTAGGIAGNNYQVGTGGSITNSYFLASTADNGVGSGGTTGTESKTADEFRSLASTLGADKWIDDPFLGRPVLKSNQEPWEGTEGQLCEIPDKATLEKVRDYINNSADGGKGKTFKLTNDINLNDESWTPIGSGGSPFQGTFDGGSFTVSGLSVTSSVNYVGLFGYIGGSGTVKNLGVSGSVTGENTVGGIAGQNEGTIENCYNAANVTGRSGNNVGGIVGNNDGGTVKNCYNSGSISGSQKVGGIVGYSDRAEVTGCYNTGTVTGSSDAGAIAGAAFLGNVYNCYYLNTAPSGIGGGELTGAEEKTEAEFKSGEVAWLLQGEQDEQVWGQNLKGDTDKYPVLTNESQKKVYKVTFYTDSNPAYDAKYTNQGGTVALPNEQPTLDGTVFDHWSTEQGASGGTKFDNNTEVTGDITVYAIGRETFGGESGDINLEATYGDGLTEDLSAHVKYKSEEATAGKFDYEIKDDNDQLNAYISGDNLIVPKDAKAGEYRLTIEAREKTPQYSLMSVSDYGTVPVTLTVNINIKKAEGKGSVTMDDYLCGQEGVEPEPKSDTNGTDNVKYTYAKRGEEVYS